MTPQSFEFTRPLQNCIHVQAKSQWDLTRAFCRVQEFYESPYAGIRGHHFTLSAFATRYAKDHNGRFTYYTDWNGFNVPGHVVREFLATFPDLSESEGRLNATLWQAMEDGVNPRAFYLVGTHQADDVEHELSHALFYLDHKYRSDLYRLLMLLQVDNLEVWKIIKQWLLTNGYAYNTLDDEVHAYLATSDLAYLQDKLGSIDGGRVYEAGAPFRALWEKHRPPQVLTW